jgi:hypothetical protein
MVKSYRGSGSAGYHPALLLGLSCGTDKSSDVIHGRGIKTSSLRKGAFLHAPPVQEPR